MLGGLGSLGRNALSNNMKVFEVCEGLVVASGLARWLPKEWWLAERPCGEGSNPLDSSCGAFLRAET
jgi:hypothetical protein